MKGLALAWCVVGAALLQGCPSPATLAPRVEVEAASPLEVEQVPGGARVVVWSRPGPEVELTLLVRAEPEHEPLGLEGASGLLVEVALDGTDEAQPREGDKRPSARALALGARLEAVADGALIGWRLVLSPCDECGADRLQRAWELLLDLAFLPELSASTVTRRAEQLRDRLLARVDTMERAAWRWAAALAVGFGRPVAASPTEEAAAHLHREALVRLHRSVMNPERMVLVGPGLGERARARLMAWSQPVAISVGCPAPPQLGFGLAGAGPVRRVSAWRAPGLGVMGRDELEATLEAARRDPILSARRVELVDLGASAALVDGGVDVEDMTLSEWLALARARTRERRRGRVDGVAVAKEVLFGRAAPGEVTLGQPVTVWWGEAERFPTLPVMLPREAPVCRAR